MNLYNQVVQHCVCVCASEFEVNLYNQVVQHFCACKVTPLAFEVNLYNQVVLINVSLRRSCFHMKMNLVLLLNRCLSPDRCADYSRQGPGDPARLQRLLLLRRSGKQRRRGGPGSGPSSTQPAVAGGPLTTHHQVV